MERSMLGAIFGSLFGITALGGLAFIGAAPNPVPGKPEGNWRLLDPVAYENITIFPVVSSSTQDTSSFLTLEEGLSSGEVVVSEQGAAGLARTRDGRPVPVPQYAGASVDEAMAQFAAQLAQALPQARCEGWDWTAKIDADHLRQLVDQ